MTIHFLQNIFEKSINGEWGNEDSGNGEATAVIRTSNFLNSGRLNLDNIVCRDIDKNKNSDKILRTGDIIIEKSGGSPNQPVGRVVYFDVTDQDYFTNNFTSILRVKPGYNSKYIFYLMKYLYDTKKVLKFQNQTTGIINLKLTDYLNKTKVNIETIENQNTIVDILDRLEYQIINRNKQLSELSNLVKSRFNEMFGGNKQFESIDNLFDIIDGDRGKNYPKSDELFDEEYCLFLNTKNVTKNGFSFITNQFITETKDKLLRKGKLERYDIVLTTRGTVGNVAYYDESIKYKHLRINSGMVILRPKKPNLNQKFIIHVLRNNNYSRVISGSAQPQLPITKLKKILLPLPPLSLQNEFTDFVAQVDKSQLAIQKSLEELETLKKSLMQEYFG